MKKIAGCACFLFILVTIAVNAQSVDLDTAIKNGAEHFEKTLQSGTTIAVLGVRSDFSQLSEYVIDQLSYYLVNGRIFTVVDRNYLDVIQRELIYQMSGDVSDETAQSIGKQIGAQTVITVGIQPFGNEYRLVLRALSVETGVLQAILSQNIKADNRLSALTGSDFTVPALEAKERHGRLELGASFSYFFQNADISGINIKTELFSFALSFSGIAYHWDKIGIGIYGNFLFPLRMIDSAQGITASYDRSVFDYLYGMDMLIGPVYIAYQHNNFAFPISAGLHFSMLSYALDTSSSLDFSFGLGTNITGEFHINERIYLLARLQMTLDFFSIGNAGYIWLTGLGMNPSIGIGFQF